MKAKVHGEKCLHIMWCVRGMETFVNKGFDFGQMAKLNFTPCLALRHFGLIDPIATCTLSYTLYWTLMHFTVIQVRIKGSVLSGHFEGVCVMCLQVHC